MSSMPSSSRPRSSLVSGSSRSVGRHEPLFSIRTTGEPGHADDLWLPGSRRARAVITVDDTMQRGYTYELVAPAGRAFHPDFRPELTPREMLELGVFGGKYMTDCQDEFPRSWWRRARLSPSRRDPSLNFFGVDASLPLRVWWQKGWIHPQDPRGWFQWYCRYYLGRRTADDARQIRRWKAMRRHVAQIQRHCPPGDIDCRRRQRQALLQWAYDSRSL